MDVVKLEDGKNLAFTNLALRLHMDVLYVPIEQMQHLSNVCLFTT